MLTTATNGENSFDLRNPHLGWKSPGELYSFLKSAGAPDDAESTLDDAARSERDYVRERLRDELKREPTESELDEWLRRHTEGY